MMRNPEERALALECLALAITAARDNLNDVVPLASDFLAFVTGESGQSPRQKIDAALDQANVS